MFQVVLQMLFKIHTFKSTSFSCIRKKMMSFAFPIKIYLIKDYHVLQVYRQSKEKTINTVFRSPLIVEIILMKYTITRKMKRMEGKENRIKHTHAHKHS